MRVLLVCYAIEAGKGSESGSGYNIARRIAARCPDLTLVTRHNNAALLREDSAFRGVEIVGYDPPRALTFWKRKSQGVIPYYYLWQIGVGRLAARLHRKRRFDVAHQYNFHADWAPHFLSLPGARTVWGPICHQPLLPSLYLEGAGGDAARAERLKWASKQFFWRFDPALPRAIRATDAILYANRDVAPPFAKARGKVHLRTFGGSDLPTAPAPTARDQALRLIHVGRMVPIKAPHIAMRALARHLKDAPGTARLTIVGEGPMHQSLVELARTLNLGDAVEILPWMAREALAAHYAAADAFLYPSLGNQDSVVAEALAAGLPVIGVEGSGTALMADQAGLAAGAGDRLLDNLATRIGELARLKARDPDGLRDWRNRAHARSAAISWDATADGIVAHYRGEASDPI